MAMANWAEEMSEAEWAELKEAVRIADEEYERGETEEYGGDTGRSLSTEVQARGRAVLAAERKKAS